MRNIWHLLKTFNKLPTDPTFRSLTDDQIDLMLLSVEQDHIEMERASKGLSVEGDHYDTSFEEEVWEKDVGEWEVLKDGHDPDDIAKQIEKLTKEEDLDNLHSRFDSLDEYNDFLEAGGQTTRETEVESYINKQIQLAQEKAQSIEARKTGNNAKRFVDDSEVEEGKSNNQGLDALDKKALEDSIRLFNEEDDEYTEI